MEFHPTDYVNDPFVIAQNDKMVAINSALAVDLTGQVCADSIGRAIYSGFGGQLDFIRGAAPVQGGKPDHRPALHGEGRARVAHRGRCSAEGSGVVTTRARRALRGHRARHRAAFGKSLRERARALIAVADPDFRPELEAAARRRHLT